MAQFRLLAFDVFNRCTSTSQSTKFVLFEARHGNDAMVGFVHEDGTNRLVRFQIQITQSLAGFARESRTRTQLSQCKNKVSHDDEFSDGGRLFQTPHFDLWFIRCLVGVVVDQWGQRREAMPGKLAAVGSGEGFYGRF